MRSIRFQPRVTLLLPAAIAMFGLGAGLARGDGHGDAASAGVTSLDVYADGPRVHLLLASRTPSGSIELYHRRSDDGGESWGNPARVGAGLPAPERAHRGSDVQIAAAGKRLVAAWQAKGTGSYGGGPMVTAVSADGGTTWKPGPNPADDGSSGGHGFIDVAADVQGNFHLVWLDSRGGHQGLRYARSTDGGRSWSKNSTLDDETCECCWNTLATGADGRVAVLYRDKNPRDMAVVTSCDGGATWGKPAVIDGFDWDIEACPHVGGGLAFSAGDPSSLQAVVWTGKPGRAGAYALRSGDDGRTWSRPKPLGDGSWHTDLAADPSGRLASVWDARGDGHGGRGIFASVSRGEGWTGPRHLSGEGVAASHPRVVATPAGFRAFWTEKSDGKEARWASRKLDASGPGESARDAASECLARLEEVHGAAGPWAVAGYRIGERALKELELPRRSARVLAVHRSPAEVQYSCVADGLQAATGASPGKLNLRLEEVPLERLSTTVEDRQTGRRLVFTLKPAFARSIANLPRERLEAEGRRVADLPDDDIFAVTEEAAKK